MNNLKEKIYLGRQDQNTNTIFMAAERWAEFSPLLVNTRDQTDQSAWDIYWTCPTILVMDKASGLAAR